MFLHPKFYFYVDLGHYLRFLDTFLTAEAPKPPSTFCGAKKLKTTLLERMGLRVISIPYFEWDCRGGIKGPSDPAQKIEYLQGLLG